MFVSISKELLMRIRFDFKSAVRLLIITILLFASMAFVALPSARADTPPVEISGEQAIMLGIVASALVFGLNFYFKSQGKQLSRNVLTIIVYGVSVALAIMWTAPALPVIPTGSDISVVSQAYLNFAILLLTQGAGILGFATLLYNWLLKKIDEKYFPPTDTPTDTPTTPTTPTTLGSRSDRSSAQGMVEYALILVLVAIVVIVALSLLGPIVKNIFMTINASLS
jgi:pilus assembly protein Flp/PilA